MYNDDDLDAAEQAGVLKKEDIQSFRDYISERRASPVADEEHFRLLSSFNDVFVSIALLMVLIALIFSLGTETLYTWLIVALVSLGLAEHFTRKRRQALPSIILVTSFLMGVFEVVLSLTAPQPENPTMSFLLHLEQNYLGWMIGFLAVAVAAFSHWRRFKVPISIAYGTASIPAAILMMLLLFIPSLQEAWAPLLFVAGAAVFVVAMRWDTSDTERTTIRSDVAFWLHLFSAPMLVHPIFFQFLDSNSGVLEGVLVVALYCVLVLIALIIDRRAVLVSALAYLLWALGLVIADYAGTGVGQYIGVVSLVIGSVLLLFSALWQNVRGAILNVCPVAIRKVVPSAS